MNLNIYIAILECYLNIFGFTVFFLLSLKQFLLYIPNSFSYGSQCSIVTFIYSYIRLKLFLHDLEHNQCPVAFCMTRSRVSILH